MRWLWLLILVLAGVLATTLWPRTKIWSRTDSARVPHSSAHDEQRPKSSPPPLLIAFDAEGRRLSPTITKEDGLYVIRCGGYVTETYMPRPGDERPVHVTLTPAVAIRGRVFLGDEEHPAEGALVECYEWPENREFVTGKDGRFEIPDLNPAMHQFLHVTLAGTLPPELNWWPEKGELKIVLGAGAKLRGKVVDSDDQPVAGARVVLLGHSVHGLDEDDSFSVVSDKNGEFEFRGLEWTDYKVVASDNTRKGRVDVPSTEQENQDRTCVVVMKESPRLHVRVIDPEGVPIKDAVVGLMYVEASWRFDFRGERQAYVSRPLDFDEYTVTVSPPGWSQQTKDLTLDRGGEQRIEFHLKDAGTLLGQVVDDVGRPVAGASVSLGRSGAETDGAGRFALRGLQAASVKLNIECEGYRTLDVAVTPTKTEQRIVLPRSGTLIGQFDPAPPERTVHSRMFLDEFDSVDSSVDVFGRFAIRGLPPRRTFDITIEVDGWIGIAVRSLRLAPGEVRDLGVLQPPEGATLTGTVHDNYGTPMPWRTDGYACVTLTSQAQEVREWMPIDEGGTYRFTDLAKVKAELMVYGARFVTRTIEVELGERTVLDVTVIRSGTLTGKASGAAKLRLVPLNGGQALQWEPEKDGSFSVNAMPGGYRLGYRVAEAWITAQLVDVVEGEELQVAVVVSDR